MKPVSRLLCGAGGRRMCLQTHECLGCVGTAVTEQAAAEAEAEVRGISTAYFLGATKEGVTKLLDCLLDEEQGQVRLLFAETAVPVARHC